MPQARWVNLVSGVPLTRDFVTANALGSPIVINTATSTPYYLAAGDIPTPFAGGGGGSGTVTSVSVTTAAGVSGSVATPTTTPAITITLGAITPTSVAASGAVTGSNLSGTNTGDQTSIVGITGTLAQFDTACTDANFLSVAAAATAYQPLDTQLTSLAGLSYAGNKHRKLRINLGETAFELAPDFYVTPETYGAVGDGVTNDTTAVQAAINTGFPVYLSLTYLYTTELSVTTSNQIIFGPGILKPSGAINGVKVSGGCSGVELELRFSTSVQSAGYCLYISNANRVRIRRLHIIDGFSGLYIEQANTVTLDWMWATLRGSGIKWYGTNALRSDILQINFALLAHAAGLYGFDWDGNCNSLIVKYLGIVCGSSVSAANAYGVIIRNTSGGAVPQIGKFDHLEVDYSGTHGIDIQTGADYDIALPYLLGSTGDGIKVGATINSREVRVLGGKSRGNTGYGINALGGVVLYDGATDLQSNGSGKTSGAVWNESIRYAVADNSYWTLSGSDTLFVFDANDYLSYATATNIGKSFIAGTEVFNWSATGFSLSPNKQLYLPPSTTTFAPLTISAGVNKTTPVDGDFWSDGVDLKYRMAGVTYAIPKTSSGGLGGVASVTVPNGVYEWEETVTAVGVVGSNRIILSLAPTADSDENDPIFLAVLSLAAAPGTGQITVYLAFLEPTSGIIKLNWSAL